jgi:hypothetical protein
MATYPEDFRVTASREFLAPAHKRTTAEYPPSVLTRENAELRRLLAWVLDVVDDYTETELDRDTSQVMHEGGVYLTAADFLSLCPDCLGRASKQLACC